MKSASTGVRGPVPTCLLLACLLSPLSAKKVLPFCCFHELAFLKSAGWFLFIVNISSCTFKNVNFKENTNYLAKPASELMASKAQMHLEPHSGLWP